jgi:hypothetical protein
LVRKPGAFARYRYREDLYPSLTFRRAYDALVRTHGERADVEYLRILHLAANAGETRVGEVLAAVLDQIGGFDYVQVNFSKRVDKPAIAFAIPVDIGYWQAGAEIEGANPVSSLNCARRRSFSDR